MRRPEPITIRKADNGYIVSLPDPIDHLGRKRRDEVYVDLDSVFKRLLYYYEMRHKNTDEEMYYGEVFIHRNPVLREDNDED